jgi:hypothetical protein
LLLGGRGEQGLAKAAELYRSTSRFATHAAAPLLRSVTRGMGKVALPLVLGLGAAACAGRAPLASRPATTESAVSPGASASGAAGFLTPARVFPPSERSEVTGEVKDSDGGRRFIAQGLRLIQSPEGALVASDEFLPGSRVVATLALPNRLGGGYLFVLNTSGSALFWRASSWTGRLVPLARIDGEVERVVAGFDRVYAARGRGAPWIALDVESGHALELATLPPSPGYGAMAFADEWFGAVEVPLRGVLATFDAGSSWHPLGFSHAELGVDDGGIVVNAPGRRFLLTASGTEQPLGAAAASEEQAEPRASPPRRLPAPLPFGERPLELAVLHGFPDGHGAAFVAARGEVARLRLSDGAVLERQPNAFAGKAACEPVPLGAGAGFVCGEPHGPTDIDVLGPGLALTPLVRFAEPRHVAPNGRGALVVRGSCAARGAAEAAYCVVPATGSSYSTPRRGADERAVALADGGLALLAPAATREKAKEKTDPAAGQAKPDARGATVGALTLVHPGAADRTLPLKLSGVDDEAARSIVRSGLWLDSFEQAPNGELIGWVAGNDGFVGVRVKLDGRVLVGAPEPHLERALLRGRFGLVVGHSGGLRETVDGGFEWSDGELPGEPDLRPLKTSGTPSGCTALGCAVSGWLRVGWKMGDKDHLTLATVPEPTRLPGSGGNRWSLECEATGEQSKPALRKSPASDDRAVSPWDPIAEVAPPARARSALGIETSNEADLRLLHAYAWGPPGDGWSREARWLVRVRDPYRVSDSVWSTAPSPVAWPSAVLTADAFGRSPGGPPATFRVVTDLVRHAGLLLVSIHGTVEIYLLEEGSRIVRVKTTGTTGVIASAAFAGGRCYVAALGEARALRLYRVEQGELELLGEFPEVGGHSELPALAPAARGDSFGVWLHDADYYLFPFDLSNRRFDAPIVTRASELSAMPASCTTGEDGYVVGDALALEPNVDLNTPGVATGNGIEVRLIVSPSRVCMDALAAPLGAPDDERARARRKPAHRDRAPADSAGLVRAPSAEPRGDETADATVRGGPARDTGPGAPLVLDAPDGSRQGFRCRD